MKFFDSEYYAPLRQKAVPSKYQKIRDLSDIRRNEGGSVTLSVLYNFCIPIPTIRGMYLSRETITKEWILVKDLTFFKSRLEEDLPFSECDVEQLVVKVYFNKGAEVFVAIMDDDEHISGDCVFCPFNVNPIKATQYLIDQGYLFEYEKNNGNKIGVLIKSPHGFRIIYNTVKHDPICFDSMYNPDFVEVSKTIINHTTRDSNKGIIILHGKPGTGKTNYIRWLTGQSQRKMVFVPTNLVGTLTEPVFMEFLLENPGLTFIVEDAEDSLVERAGGRNSVVSNILNLTDGLLGDVLKCQFICTFNTGINNIDKALLRPGRLLVEYEFKELEPSVVERYLKMIGTVDTVDSPVTLSELINRNNLPTKTPELKKRSIGFT